MTAEQLEELLHLREYGDMNQKMRADMRLESITPSLARRVIAAEKLVEALDRTSNVWRNHPKVVLDAITAYREASK